MPVNTPVSCMTVVLVTVDQTTYPWVEMRMGGRGGGGGVKKGGRGLLNMPLQPGGAPGCLHIAGSEQAQEGSQQLKQLQLTRPQSSACCCIAELYLLTQHVYF